MSTPRPWSEQDSDGARTSIASRPVTARHDVNAQPRVDPTGLFDVRYAAFLETVAHLRMRLHRDCTRMTGSVLDGEDVMQETLFEAYRKIALLDDLSMVGPWLSRIAHNRCIDFIRKRQARERAEMLYLEDEVAPTIEPPGLGYDRAIERLIANLPPKERACVLLKDVLDYSLEEIAGLVDSTVGGVKSALSRGRAKLAALPAEPIDKAVRRTDPELAPLLRRYVELFNRRDWDAVRALTSADAQLRVSDCFKGALSDSPYFIEYTQAHNPWKADVGEIDGELVVVMMARREHGWEPAYPVRVSAEHGVITQIADYYACPWMVPAAGRVLLHAAPPSAT